MMSDLAGFMLLGMGKQQRRDEEKRARYQNAPEPRRLGLD